MATDGVGVYLRGTSFSVESGGLGRRAEKAVVLVSEM